MIGLYGAPCVQTHSAQIFDRGGRKHIANLLDVSIVQWERVRDNVSEATVRVEGDACSEQLEMLMGLRTHRHELVIHRGRDRVWEGPLHRLSWDRFGVNIVAHDVLEYVMSTPLTQTWSNAHPNDGLVSSRIGEIMEYELTHGRVQLFEGVPHDVPAWEDIDAPANIVDYIEVHNFPNEARTSIVTYPYEMTVGEHLESLSRYQGIDYTAVGRSIHIWDVSRALGRTPQLTEANFLDGVVVTEYGADHTQAAYVLGMPPEDSKVPIYGSALDVDHLDYYGPWTTIYTPYDEDGSETPTQGELNSQAQRNLAGRTPSPTEVRIPDNSGVLLDDDLTILKLIPGVQVPLRSVVGTRPYSQMQKIDRVVVRETAEDGERISMTLSPTARPDPDQEIPSAISKVQANFPGGKYVLHARASAIGNSYTIKATVEEVVEEGRAGTNVAWLMSGERIPGVDDDFSGTWSYDFGRYNKKTVAVRQVDNAAPGMRAFEVSVSIDGLGLVTVGGTVEIR